MKIKLDQLRLKKIYISVENSNVLGGRAIAPIPRVVPPSDSDDLCLPRYIRDEFVTILDAIGGVH